MASSQTSFITGTLALVHSCSIFAHYGCTPEAIDAAARGATYLMQPPPLPASTHTPMAFPTAPMMADRNSFFGMPGPPMSGFGSGFGMPGPHAGRGAMPPAGSPAGRGRR